MSAPNLSELLHKIKFGDPHKIVFNINKPFSQSLELPGSRDALC